jgi:hypothetical protein
MCRKMVSSRLQPPNIWQHPIYIISAIFQQAIMTLFSDTVAGLWIKIEFNISKCWTNLPKAKPADQLSWARWKCVAKWYLHGYWEQLTSSPSYYINYFLTVDEDFVMKHSDLAQNINRIYFSDCCVLRTDLPKSKPADWLSWATWEHVAKWYLHGYGILRTADNIPTYIISTLFQQAIMTLFWDTVAWLWIKREFNFCECLVLRTDLPKA